MRLDDAGFRQLRLDRGLGGVNEPAVVGGVAVLGLVGQNLEHRGDGGVPGQVIESDLAGVRLDLDRQCDARLHRELAHAVVEVGRQREVGNARQRVHHRPPPYYRAAAGVTPTQPG